MELAGIHHVTAVSGRIRDTRRFYSGVMGLRLVKRTVNQDDVRSWQLFYGDARGTPGTICSFYDWAMPPGRHGTNCIFQTQMRVNGREALEWWQVHLVRHGVRTRPLVSLGGRLSLEFEDPEGQRLAIVDDEGQGKSWPWEGSPVPPEYQIRGMGPFMLSVRDLRLTDGVLRRVLNVTPRRDYAHRDNPRHVVHVYDIGDGGASSEVHVAVQPDLPNAELGAGDVHHVAFLAKTLDEHAAWIDRLTTMGIANSGPIDRHWFRSVHFRDPNGLLFSIATEGPGFTVDEPLDELGETVKLPPALEPRRGEILAALPPLDSPGLSSALDGTNHPAAGESSTGGRLTLPR